MPANYSSHGNFIIAGKRDFTTDILSGKLSDLPCLPTKTVKIYICSNKSDFEVERERLWMQALPELHLCCLHYGLDLQLVDVHQGSDVDHVLDSHVFEEHLTELQECSQLSKGPFFLCLLGNKYGKPPLPTYLDETEFTHIKNEAFEGGKDVRLMDEWYVKDRNCVPPAFRLVPLTSKFKHYYDRNPSNGGLHERDVMDWQDVYARLLDIIQFGAREAFKEGLINQVHHSKQDRFFLSGIEQELKKALEKSVKGCVCIMRTIDNIDVNHTMAESFTDVHSLGHIDKDRQKIIQTMREFVAFKLNDKNKHTFNIPWTDQGVVPSKLDSHYDYVDDFNAAVVTKLRHLIDEAAKSCSGGYTTNGSGTSFDVNKEKLCELVLPHLHHCLELGKRFVSDGFKGEIEQFRKLLTAGSRVDHKAVLLCGPESGGKSSMLAHVASHVVPEVLGKDTILIARFGGLTSYSSSNETAVQSISQHIQAHLGLEVDLTSKDKDTLSIHYQNLLQCLSRLSRQLVIILDDVKNPKSVLEDHCGWLTCRLPPRVHIIVSFTGSSNLSDAAGKNNGKQSNCNVKENLIFLPSKDEEQLRVCLQGMLGKHKRTLTLEQENVILQTALTTRSLRLLAFLANQGRRWVCSDSMTEDGENMLANSYAESVMNTFDRLEKKHGVIFVSQISRYLTLSRHGLTEMELLDLLSINDDVILSCYPQQLPSILRFPNSLWYAIKADMDFLLSRHSADNKQVYCWSHVSIAQVAWQRYCQQASSVRQNHKYIAQIFLEMWIDNKPLIDKERNIQMIDSANRLLCPQPLLYSETRYNWRRISEMWYHLLHAGEVESFKEYAYCCFEYLLATAHSTSVYNLMSNLETSVSLLLDAEVNLVLRAMKLSFGVLLEDSLQLANELIGRLRQLKEYYSVMLDSLVTECMQWCDSYSLPLIVPLTPWLPDPRKPLITSLDTSDRITRLLPSRNSQHILCSSELNHIYMYHVPSKKLVSTFIGHAGKVLCLALSSTNKTMVSGSADSTVRVWDISSGQCTNVISEHDGAVLSVALSHKDTLLASGSADKTVIVVNMESMEVQRRLREHSAPVTAVIFNSMDSVLATASMDQKMILWYLDDMTILNNISQGITSPIVCMTLSVDNTFLLIGCDDGTVHVFSFTTGTEIHQLQGHDGKVSSLTVSQDCLHAVIGCNKGTVNIYNLCTKELLHSFGGGHKSAIVSVCMSCDENMIFTASKSKVCVWNMYKEVTKEVSDDNHSGHVTTIAISTNGKLAVTGGKDGLLKLWNLELSVFTENLSGHMAPITCVTLPSDEAFVLSGSQDKTVKVWSIIMASVITNYTQHESAIDSVYVLNDNMRVMSMDHDHRLRLWTADTGQTLFTYSDTIPVMALSHNSEYVFSKSGQNSLKIWKLSDSSVVQTVSHKGEITCVTCTEDSEHVITGSDDMSLKVWETSTGKLTQVLVEHQAPVSCVTTTQNSCNIISGSCDHSIIVWILGTGSVDHHLRGHRDVITVLRVTTDGSILISGSRDGMLRVWNIIHGCQLTLFDMHVPVADLTITFDACHIVVHLVNNCHVPLLCLHNTPATEVKSQSQVSIEMVNSISGDGQLLPLKPHPPLVHRPSSVFPVPKQTKFKRRESRFSISTMPEIIKVSPIKAPVQSALLAQERKKEKKQKAKNKIQRKQTNGEPINGRKSGICSIL